MWIKHFIESLTKINLEPIELLIDNQAAIQIGSQKAVTERNKHFDIRLHIVREKVSDRTILLTHCPTKEQAADLLTKPLPWVTFEFLLKYYSF